VLLAVAAGAVLALFLAGRAVHALGPRRAALVTALTMGMLLAMVLHWPHWWLLLLASLVFGSAMSILDVAINTEGTMLEALEGHPIMGNLHGTFSLGAMAGAALAGALIGLGWPAGTQLAAFGVVSAFAAVASTRAMLPAHPPLHDEAGGPTSGRTGFRPQGPLLILGLLAFAGMGAEGAMYDWSVLYLQQEVGLPAPQAALGYSAFAAAMALARFGGDSLRRRYPERLLLRAGGATSALAMALVLLTGNPVVSYVGYALIGGGLAMVVPIIYNAATRVPGTARASAIATVSAIGYSGFLLGPPLIGGIAHAWSLTWALAAVVAMSALLAWGARHVPAANSPVLRSV
jgi:fucose permease